MDVQDYRSRPCHFAIPFIPVSCTPFQCTEMFLIYVSHISSFRLLN